MNHPEQLQQSTPETDERYQNHILQHVSRTFALTIPQLPAELAKVVGNAYLLCRIADTIEDDKDLSAESKRLFAERFIEVVQGNLDAKEFAEDLHPLLSPAATEAEKDLIANTESVIRITHACNKRQRAAVERCVAIMAEGMSRYQEAETLEGVDDQAAMDTYCYYVAGVVGEMLTELFCDYSDAINQNYDLLFKHAVSFGQGLQMTNILKDIWDDQKRGACWLPAETFAQYAFDLTELQKGKSSIEFQQGLRELVGIALAHLDNALEYTLMIPTQETGIRKFCLWAIGMAVLTLRKINNRLAFVDAKEVKISRNSVKATMLSTHLLVKYDTGLKLLFSLAAKGLPRKQLS